MNEENLDIKYKPIVFEEDFQRFKLDPQKRIVNFEEVALKILLCLRDFGPIDDLKYASKRDTPKEFKAEISTKKVRSSNIIRKAIKFTTTKGGGSTWKLDDKSLQHMLDNGDRYGIEGEGNTRGTYHGHALEPLVNYFLENEDIHFSIEEIEYLDIM